MKLEKNLLLKCGIAPRGGRLEIDCIVMADGAQAMRRTRMGGRRED